MGDWSPSKSDLKRYPHFDKYLPPSEIEAIVKDPNRVRTNAFFPFLRYTKSWQPFRKEGARPKKKERPIRYASRRDACIFGYYRHLLSARYETVLAVHDISDCVIAYRKIPVAGNDRRGKCNIHFAKDAFDSVSSIGNCCAVSLDISSYFESIDHEMLHRVWCQLLDVNELPPDHAQVFTAITRYAVVDRNQAYERLGFYGPKPNGVKGFLKPFCEMPMQLCTPKEFREKICGGVPGYSSIIEVNKKHYGIPQGAPISDLLANAYLMEFDCSMSAFARERGGVYYRYSDDILLIVPGGQAEGEAARDFTVPLIKQFGDQLVIKPEKSSLIQFSVGPDGQTFRLLSGSQGKNGLEYLGFRFDGRKVYLRDSTLSAFYRKVTYSARRAADAQVARYPGKDVTYVVENFDLEAFLEKFGRVEDFEESSEYRTWTFWTYARRAAEIFGQRGKKIHGQLRRHRRLIRDRIESEIATAVVRRLKRKSRS